jgi:GST-like protein
MNKMYKLYTASTPNGYKVSIMLEAIQTPYEIIPMSLGNKEQKQPWFLKLNPNGRIPVLVDSTENDFVVFESGAILLYLAEQHSQLLPQDKKRRSTVIQWLMFQMGGLGPMQGQANVFNRYAPEKIPYAQERYTKETRRLYEVMNHQLEMREYIAADYSIADIALFPWVHRHEWSMVSLDGLDNLNRWFKEMSSKSEVIDGMSKTDSACKKEKDRTIQIKNGAAMLG